MTASGGPTLRSTFAAALTASFILGTVLDAVGFAGSAISARVIGELLLNKVDIANSVKRGVGGAGRSGLSLHH